MELDQRSVVERNMLQNASYEFENGNILCLTLTDTIVAQGKKDSLSTYLSDVFEERFHRPVEIRVLYEKAKDSKLKYNEAKLEQEIEAIREQSQAVKAKKAQELEQKRREERRKRPKQKATQQEKAGTIPKVAEEVQVDLRRAAHSEKVDIPLYVKLPMIQTLSTDVILTMRR